MNKNDLARAITKAGMILLENGAETYRVEDTMKRICYAYGADVVDAFATPTLVIISFSLDNELYHNIKRTQLKSVDLHKIDLINDLSRTIQTQQISLDEFYKQLECIEHGKKYSSRITKLGAAICTFGFALFFGGSFTDALSSLVLGMVVQSVMLKMESIDFTSFFKFLILGAFVTMMSFLLYRFHLCQNIDTLIISVNMLLVPGLAITNAIRDLVNGDLVSGLARSQEAVFIAVAIALGSGLVFALAGGYGYVI